MNLYGTRVPLCPRLRYDVVVLVPKHLQDVAAAATHRQQQRRPLLVTKDLVITLERCFISPNVSDSNMEPANLVDVMDRAARNLAKIAQAITPTDSLPMTTPNGGSVGSLTEGVIFAAESLSKIAEAIDNLACAMRGREA